MAKAYNYELEAALKEIMAELRDAKERYEKDVTAYTTAIDVLTYCSAKEILGSPLTELKGKLDAANAELTLTIAFLTLGNSLLYEFEKYEGSCEMTASKLVTIVKTM